MVPESTFDSWDQSIHELDEQQKRISSAQKAETSPSKVDKENFMGVFPGSGGKSYQTSLASCTCVDFARRKLPCKHIYRLAMECGVFDKQFKTGVNKNTLKASQFSLRDAVAELEKLETADQIIIKMFLCDHLYHDEEYLCVLKDKSTNLLKSPLLQSIDSPESIALRAFKRNQILHILDEHGITGFKRNSSRDKLISWCIENIQDCWSVFPKVCVFQFSLNFQSAQRKVYSYLLRKFDWELYFDGEKEIRYPHGAMDGDLLITFSPLSEEGQTPSLNDDQQLLYFPNDEITELLTFYGCNRCLNGFRPESTD